MPNYYCFIKKGEELNQVNAASRNDMDIEICKILGVEVHKKYWGGNRLNWDDIFGWAATQDCHLGTEELAKHLHRTWSEDITPDENPRPQDIKHVEDLLKVKEYLEENYVSYSWYGMRM